MKAWYTPGGSFHQLRELTAAQMLVRMEFVWHPGAIAVEFCGELVTKEQFDQAFEDSIPLGEK